jgi:LmbE family N-acetylglucosaminyl deacetylase
MKKVLVLAVHPDDETLGAGGTILRHISENDKVSWLTITEINKNSGHNKKEVDIRNKELIKVNEKYKFHKSIHLSFTTAKLESYEKSKLISEISSVVNELKPDVIYLQHPGDAHSDHKVVFEAAFACTKTFRYPFIKEIYCMETISETDFSAPYMQNQFIPNHFVDITQFIEDKIKIMNIYKSEIGEHPFPRCKKNIISLANLRGSQAGVQSAEAFMCLKHIR